MYFYMLLLIYIIRVKNSFPFSPKTHIPQLWILQKSMYNNVRIVFLFIITVIDVLRISNGYQGNLKESV